MLRQLERRWRRVNKFAPPNSPSVLARSALLIAGVKSRYQQAGSPSLADTGNLFQNARDTNFHITVIRSDI